MKKSQKIILATLLLVALVLGIAFSQTLGKESTVSRISNSEIHTMVSSGAQAKTREFKSIDKNGVSRINNYETVQRLNK